VRIDLSTDNDNFILLDNRLDTSGDAWIREDGVKGLYGATKPREMGEARPQGHGSYWPSRFTAESRVITLDCVVACKSSIEAMRLMDRINELSYQPVSVIVSDASGRRTLTGFVADSPEQTMLLNLEHLTFSLIIHCPDPFRYGDPVEYNVLGGSVDVVNTGNMESWPRVQANGVSSLTVSLAGKRVSWQGSTAPLTLDFADMQPNQGIVTYSDAFAIPPGRSTVMVVSNPAGRISMSVRPCWV
jgi:hypothetical protein